MPLCSNPNNQGEQVPMQLITRVADGRYVLQCSNPNNRGKQVPLRFITRVADGRNASDFVQQDQVLRPTLLGIYEHLTHGGK